jgi:hypothetical protein
LVIMLHMLAKILRTSPRAFLNSRLIPAMTAIDQEQ